MCGMVDQLYSSQVILYDHSKKTGYLCRLINLIVSLVRAYLRDHRYAYDTNLLDFRNGIENDQAKIRDLVAKQTDESISRAFTIITKRYSALNASLRLRYTNSEIFRI